MLDYLGDLQRTHMCGELRASNAGARVTLMGWVNRRRDLGGLIFVDVRDRSGLTQVVFDPQRNPDVHAKAAALRNEYVIAVTGTVAPRDKKTVNPNLPTGEIEIIASELRLLNTSDTPPFSPADATLPNEEVRLQYRYLDLRRAPMQYNLELRHKVALGIRQYLSSRGFLEVETPFMTRSTPEGARDYLVPSRVYPGSFYALPQSPQLFKQILMIGGTDKYFQIVRCFRDEDLRADRQPEFTQLDLEMSWATQERVFEVIEGMLVAAWEAAGVRGIKTPFPRMTYDEAIRLYGSDKPDLRLPAMTDVRGAFAPENLNTLNVAPDLPFVAIRIPGVGELSRRERDQIKPLLATTSAAKSGVKVFEDAKRLEKSFPDAMAQVRQLTGAIEGDLLVFVAAPSQSPVANVAVGEADSASHPPTLPVDFSPAGVFTAAGVLRVALAQKFPDRHKLFAGDIKDAASYHFLWVTDFPMFEWLPEENRWQAAHHPFTSPHERDMENVLAHRDLSSVRSNAYDVVLNGMELGSGSIRIHRQDVQQAIFRALGMSDEEARSRFGFFLEALKYGTPPHGGIALGIDRITMLLAGADSLREVIPFPKTAKAVDLMVDAPTHVSEIQLQELGILSAPDIERHIVLLGKLISEVARKVEDLSDRIAYVDSLAAEIERLLPFAADRYLHSKRFEYSQRHNAGEELILICSLKQLPDAMYANWLSHVFDQNHRPFLQYHAALAMAAGAKDLPNGIVMHDPAIRAIKYLESYAAKSGLTDDEAQQRARATDRGQVLDRVIRMVEQDSHS